MLIALITGVFLIIVFSGVIIFLAYRRRKDHTFDNLLPAMPHLDESGNVDRAYYNDIVRANHLKEILCAIITDSLTSDLLKKYVSDLNDEIKLKVTDYLVKKEIEDISRGGNRSQRMLNSCNSERNEIVKGESSFNGQIAEAVFDVDAMGSFLLLANIIDSKTGRDQHSLHVAENAYRIACTLGEREINPLLVKNAALVHDIGFLGL